MNLMEQVKLFPSTPGVYIMKDSWGNIIYIGKAKKLKNRVIQYFYHRKDRLPKIDEMIKRINSIEYILTDTELEAFLMECKLIKKFKPIYNSQMKNDNKYVYIKININDKQPGIYIVGQKDEESSLFFGPYTSRSSVERVVDFIKESYPIRKCGSTFSAKNSSGCFNYSMGICMGICREDVDYEAYRKCIDQIVLLLEGRDDSVIKDLKNKINLAAETLEFEKAANYRDDLKAINYILKKQNLIKISSKRKNIIAMEPIGENCYKIFIFKGNRLIYTELFSTKNMNKTNAEEYFYHIIINNCKVNNNFHISEFLSKQEIDEAQIIYSYLKRKKNEIMSFWIPASWLVKDNSKLRTEIGKIVGQIFQK